MEALSRRLFATCSIRRFILRISVIFSAIGFLVIYLGATQAYDTAVRDSAVALADSKAAATFDDMYQVMSRGWSRKELETYLDGLAKKSRSSEHNITVFRGPIVEALYGRIRQQPTNELLQRSFETAKPEYQSSNELFRYSYPLLAEVTCLSCHQNAKVGDVLGAIEIQQDLGPILSKAKNGLLINLIALSPLPLALAWLVVHLLNRRIRRSINMMEQRIDNVQSLSDLTQLKLQNKELGFTDLNRIFAKVEGLADKMRNIAVDKDLLEFEIRLLERFVITSEVVKDWHDYVCQMLLEINQVIPVCNLFSIFKVDNEVLALEIFWAAPPTADTKQQLEVMIRKKLWESEYFHGALIQQVNHHIANSNAAPVSLNHQQIEYQTKSLLLETPHIGGIVGIGVHSETTRDQTRMLVMESILSTLLNVVGSVKAIYKYTQDLEYYATRDPLTDLYNQRLFWELIGYEINRSKRHNYKTALLFIDMDNFKSINDSYGHTFGDHYLQEFAKAVKQTLRVGDILARYGGDEFVIILPECDLEESAQIGGRVLHAVAGLTLTAANNKEVHTTVSIGTAIYPDHADTPKDLFMFADNIMYKAKSEGKNRICVPTENDVLKAFKDISDKSRVISAAIESKQITPYFQPIYGMKQGVIEAVEVLSRINLENGQVMGAHEFIEVAETLGLIHSLDYLVIERALKQVNLEKFNGLVFVNLSPRSLVLAEFLPRICQIVDSSGIDRSRIVLEITERDTVKNLTLLEQLVTNLKTEGFQLAIDDFGSGFSSFHYLKHFPVDFVKIEGEFIANMVSSGKDASIVRCIAGLAQEMGAKTVAEFIESDEVSQAVRRADIDLGQGFYLGRPQPTIYPPRTGCSHGAILEEGSETDTQ